jgi:hypothetical protein
MISNIKMRNIISNVRNKKLMARFDDKEFSLFLKKFLGVLKSKGKNKHSISSFYFILFKLKKKFKIDPIEIFFIIIKKLMPN